MILFVALGAWAPKGQLAAQRPVDSISIAELLVRYQREAGLRFGYEAAALPIAYCRLGTAPLSLASWPTHAQQLQQFGLISEQTEDGVILLRREDSEERKVLQEASLVVRIIDEAGEPLPGSTLLAADGRGWVTDEQGTTQVPKAAWQTGLEVRFLGMETVTIEKNTEGTSPRLIQMRAASQVAPVAVVIARLSPKPLTTVQSAQAKPSRGAAETGIQLYTRALEGFGFTGIAGASRLDGRSSVPALRGSLPSETLVTLDGIPLYYLDHYFGLFPAVDPQLIGNVELHRSHYPAAFGGVTGGMLSIDSREAVRDSLTIEASQLALGISGVLDHGPWQLLVGARSSLGELASGQLLRTASVDLTAGLLGTTAVVEPDFRFSDGYTRIVFRPLKSRWSAALQAFGSEDRYDYRYDQASIRFAGLIRQTEITGSFSEANQWRNRGGRAEASYAGKELLWKISAYHSSYTQSLDEQGETRLITRRGERLLSNVVNALRNEVVDQQLSFTVGSLCNSPSSLSLTQGLELANPASGSFAAHRTRISEGVNHAWEAGVQVQSLATLASVDINRRRPLDQTDTSKWLHAFTQHTVGWQNWQANVGLRASHRQEASKTWLSPRLQIAHVLGNSTFTVGYSLTKQALRPLQHENQFGQTYTLLVADLGVPEAVDGVANNYTLGYRYRFRAAQLSVEAYQRDLSGVLAALSQQVSLPSDAQLVNLQPNFLSVVGEGDVRGLDTDVRYQLGTWSGQVAYTLAQSRRRFAEVADNAWQRAPDDRRHRVATSHLWQEGPWTLGVAMEFATGLTYVDLNVLSPGSGSRATLDPNTFLRSLPSYERVDLSAHYSFRIGPSNVRAGARLYNVFDRDNVTQRQYVVGVGGGGDGRAVAVGTDVSLLGRLLIAELRVAL